MRKRGVGSAWVWDDDRGNRAGWRVAAVLAALLCGLLVLTLNHACGASGQVSDKALEKAVREELHGDFVAEVKRPGSKGEKVRLLRSGTSSDSVPIEFEELGRERISVRCYGDGAFRPMFRLVGGGTKRGAQETCGASTLATFESDGKISAVTVTAGDGMWISWALVRTSRR